MTRPPAILIVDDEPSVRKVLERVFQREGFHVALADSGEKALELLPDVHPDIVVLDLDMPGMSGHEVCRRIRRDAAFETVGILVLTGRTTQGLPTNCLTEGADDFVDKPFESDELVARVRAILRRPRTMVPMDGVVRRGPLVIEMSLRRVTLDGVPVDFAPKEFDLLAQLALHSPRVIDRNTLALKVWGVTIDLLNGRTIDVHIRRIRKKLGVHGGLLRTVQTVGLQWDWPAPASSSDASAA